MSRFSLLLEGKDETVAKIELPEVEHLCKDNYVPTNCVLMFGGDAARSDLGNAIRREQKKEISP
ncbi:MAG: hypothetical protein ABSG73_14260 [Candidatus Aminicenantales bacterium]|jgi:predicted Zn-dependent peptidase